MKTQLIQGFYDVALSAVSPARAKGSGRSNGHHPDFQPVAAQPIVPGQFVIRRPTRNGRGILPASLEDWLICHEALEIRQRSQAGGGNGNHSWVKPVGAGSREKMPVTANLNSETIF